MGDHSNSNGGGGVVLRDLPLGAAIVSDSCSTEMICAAGYKYHCEGGNFAVRDSSTDETFVHLVTSKPQVYCRADRVGFLYLLCCKNIDLDAKDSSGDTALHKVVQHRGTHRMITCLLRCGADPLVKNSQGKTAEQILRTEQPDGWEENLHWLQKFLPGLFHAVLKDDPDLQLVERLLKSWCRLCKVMDGQVRWLKCLAHKHACSLRIIMLLEKYENTIELALAALAGKTLIIQNWRKEDIMKNMDINARDSSYQYGYPDYPSSPRPLLAAVWETNNYDMVAELMKMEPDLSVTFRFEPEAHHKAKPLFFYVIDPKIRPEDERIVRRVLQDSDLSARNTLGQTILFEAAQHDVSEALFSFILSQGCDVAARDRYGRTARDYSVELDKRQYVSLVDEHVSRLVRDCNIRVLETLILKGYDHVTDLDVVRKRGSSSSSSSTFSASGGGSRLGSSCQARHKDSRQLEDLISDAGKKQEHVKKMFEAVKSSSTLCLRKLLSKKYATAQDKGGRTVLHHAIEHGHRKLVENIVKEFPQIINVSNNMGQTPLHYAQLFMFTDDTVDYLVSKGACTDAKDVEGWTPADYVRRAIGVHAHEQMQQRVRDLELDLFLSATNFDVSFLQAIRDGDKRHVEALATRLRDHGGMRRFNSALFECVDTDNQDMACLLIRLGFSTDVYKQYEMCEPDDPMCAMMECSHAMTSFRQRVEQVHAGKVLQLMDDMAKGKVKPKGTGCCLGRCIRPSLQAITPAQS